MVSSKTQVVIQGIIFDRTPEVVDSWLKLPSVERVIVSTWKGSNFVYDHPLVTVIESELPPSRDNVTMNYQIVSSRAGLNTVTSEMAIKARSDQIVSLDSLLKMEQYVNRFKREYLLFVLGIYKIYPFHPQDHIVWGYTKDVQNFFNCPLLPDYLHYWDFKKYIRFPIWLGVNYAARFYNRVNHYIDQYTKFLSDKSTDIEALIVSKAMTPFLFKSFPPEINMDWFKYQQGYMYEMYSAGGECYGTSWNE